MWVAPCSWRTNTSLIFEPTKASKIGIAAPPDNPQIYSTPKFSRQRTSASAPFICFLGLARAVFLSFFSAFLIIGRLTLLFLISLSVHPSKNVSKIQDLFQDDKPI